VQEDDEDKRGEEGQDKRPVEAPGQGQLRIVALALVDLALERQGADPQHIGRHVALPEGGEGEGGGPVPGRMEGVVGGVSRIALPGDPCRHSGLLGRLQGLNPGDGLGLAADLQHPGADADGGQDGEQGQGGARQPLAQEEPQLLSQADHEPALSRRRLAAQARPPARASQAPRSSRPGVEAARDSVVEAGR
jgi:hypothetical protein